MGIRDDITRIGIDTFSDAVPCLYKAANGSEISIKGIFISESTELRLQAGLPLLGKQSSLDIALADLLPVTPGSGDKVVIDSVEYKVSKPLFDGGGGVRLILIK